MINTLEEFKERVALIVRSTGVLEKDKERNQKSIKEFLNEASTYLAYLEALKKAKADVYRNNTLNAKIAELEAKKTIFDGYFKLAKANINYYDYYDFNELIYKLSNPKTLEDFNTNLVILINIFKEMGIFLLSDISIALSFDTSDDNEKMLFPVNEVTSCSILLSAVISQFV